MPGSKIKTINQKSTKVKKAEYILRVLNGYYPNPQVPLHYSSPYTLLVAVMLSAQCTDARVNLVTPELFKRADTPQKMTQLSIEEIFNIIRPCGLGPAKSKNIYNTSAILCEKYQGVVPCTLEELEALPGVGHKTASVMLIQAFAQDAFPVDTHIHRLLTRWGITSGKSVEQTEKDAKDCFPKKSWSKLHLQLIYYGREYCPARGHTLQNCKICNSLFIDNKT